MIIQRREDATTPILLVVFVIRICHHVYLLGRAKTARTTCWSALQILVTQTQPARNFLEVTIAHATRTIRAMASYAN